MPIQGPVTTWYPCPSYSFKECSNDSKHGMPYNEMQCQNKSHEVLHVNPAELWITTINLSASDAGLFFCTLSTSGIYCIYYERDACTICLKPLANLLPFEIALDRCNNYCCFLFSTNQINTTEHSQTRAQFKMLKFLPPLNSQQLQPTRPLITNRFSSSCLEP